MMRVYIPPPSSNKRPLVSSPLSPDRKRRRLDYDFPQEQDQDGVVPGLLPDSESSSGDDQDTHRVRFSPDIQSVKAIHYRADKTNWWTKADRQDFIADCRENVDDFKDHPEVEHYRKVRDQAVMASNHASSEILQGTAVSLPTEVRGLEWGFCDKTSARQDHVQAVLAVQNSCQLNPRMRSRLMANRSISSSLPSRIMARIMGESDEKSVKRLDMQHPPQWPQRGGPCRDENPHQPVRRVKARMWW